MVRTRTVTGTSGRKATPLAGRTFWLLTRQDGRRVEALSVTPDGGEEALPVFAHREEAEMFLRLGTFRADVWRVRQTGRGELISLLCDPCRRVGRVVLDPLPDFGAGSPSRAPSMGRERFLKLVLGRRGGAFGRAA